MSSKEILTILSRLDVPVANHMSVMDDHMVNKVEQFFSDVKQRAAQRHATEVERELREKQRQRERAARQAELQRAAELKRADNRFPTASERNGITSARTDAYQGLSQNRMRDANRSTTGGASSPVPRSSDAAPAQPRPQGNSGVVERARPAEREVSMDANTAVNNAGNNVVNNAVNNGSAQRQSTESTVRRDITVAANVEPAATPGEKRTDRSVEVTGQTEAVQEPERLGGSAVNQEQSNTGRSEQGNSERSATDRTAGNRYNGQGHAQGQRTSDGRQDRRGSGDYQGRRDGGSGDRDRQGQSGAGRSGGYNQGQGGQRTGGFGQGAPRNADANQGRSGGYGQGQGQGGNRSGGGGYGNRPSGPSRDARPAGAGGGRDGRPGGGFGGGGNRDGRPAGGYGGGGGRDGGRPAGGYGGGGGRPAGGYGGGGRDGGRPAGGYGGGGGGGRPGGNFGGGRPGGGFGGGRPGGGSGGGRPNSALAVASTKPANPMARKDKEKDLRKDSFDRDRKEQFNEDKLTRSGARRPGGVRQEQRRPEVPTKVTVEGPMSVGDFAKLIKREPSEIIKKLLFLGIMATINQEIETDAMELIAGEWGIELDVVEPVDQEALDMLVEEDKAEDLNPRPPVVTIMGHVDHGKTTLLDAIRESKVTATESGGITQHIGAYQVEVGSRLITFLDTPGHEAFTTMRARGAQVTDVTILVVAADDGVMPQTVEAINHAKAANVPIVVAVNKMDKLDANPDRVKQELSGHGLVPEEWGGDTVFVNVSALKRENLDALLEMVLLVADVADLKANPTGRARGTVIEAKLDKGRGPVATVLVQNGTVRVGDILVAGTTYGRVRAMVNDLGKRMKEAGPSTPVEIQGLAEVPSAGDLFVVYDDERAARNLVQRRSNRERAEAMSVTSRVTLDDLYRQIKEGNVKDLNVIVKADVQGSVEALGQAIERIEVEGVRVKVIHKGAGAIKESDVSLASASNAIIIGFHVRPDVNAVRMAEAEKVDIRLYRVIYNVTEELESAMKGLLDPEFKEVVFGHAEVRQVYKISKVGTVAGCYVTDGKITRDAEARLIREGVVVYEGSLESLKRFKDDAREVATGFECGITLEKFSDVKVGDVIEAFKMEAVKVH